MIGFVRGFGVLSRGKNATPARVNMSKRHPSNAPGEVYVDKRCIDCDTCRWLAPEIFNRQEGQSVVYKQPESEEDTRRALRAAVACPTGSIRTETRNPLAAEARDSFPMEVHPGLSGVYYNGWVSQKSYGASSYLIIDEEVGGIMVDSPRYSATLAKNMEKIAGEGNIRYMMLTHSDDVADHDKWAERFGLTRIMHTNQLRKHQGTDKVEWALEGEGPWKVSEDIEILFVPGHSNGCICLHSRGKKTVFTGDFYGYSERIKSLTGFPRYNHYSWDKQVENMKALTEMDIEYVLPGHGRKVIFESPEMKWQMFEHFLRTEARAAVPNAW